LGLIVVNPELRMFLRDDCRDLVHGLQRGLFVPVVARNITMIEAGLEVHDVAIQARHASSTMP
jgi:hypothetical protein